MATEHRKNRIYQTLINRQNDLVIVLDEVHDDHNVNAILRSAEAVGVSSIYLKYKDKFPELGYKASASSYKWLDYHKYSDINSLVDTLRRKELIIYSTIINKNSISIYDIDWTKPSAIVMGNENKGVSDKLRRMSDKTIYIPMKGMVESLNVSVAAAVILYEASRQRMIGSQYPNPKLTPEWIENKFKNWININHKEDESS